MVWYVYVCVCVCVSGSFEGEGGAEMKKSVLGTVSDVLQAALRDGHSATGGGGGHSVAGGGVLRLLQTLARACTAIVEVGQPLFVAL